MQIRRKGLNIVSLRNYYSKMKYFNPLKAGLLVLFAFSSITFSFTSSPESDITGESRRLVSLRSDEYKDFSTTVYNKIQFEDDTLDREVFDKAFRGYLFLSKTGQLEDTRYLTVIDFTVHCNEKRLWIFDLNSGEVIYHELVAHGVNSGKEYAYRFSNRHSSNQSSLGFYITGGTYYGRNGLSLKLHGLEPNFNSNAYSRGIVIHGANYVNEAYIRGNERIGRSYGCPAVSTLINANLVHTIKGGSCVFMYHSEVHYNSKSELINANLYIPVDELAL